MQELFIEALREATQFVIAYRADLAGLGAMNLRWSWDDKHHAIGKRPSYGRVDPTLNTEAVLFAKKVCNTDITTARLIVEVWNTLAFGYDEGYAHGAGEDDPVQESDLTQYDIWLRADGSGEVIFSHPWMPCEGETFCGICGETPDGSVADQHSYGVYINTPNTKEA